MSQSLQSRTIGSGSKNAAIQIQGQANSKFDGEWQVAVTLEELSPPAKILRLDAIYHAISEGLEIQLAWESDIGEIQVILPIAGRGRIDFAEVSGVHTFIEGSVKSVMLRVLGESKNPTPCFLLILDFSKHQGAL